jgi:DDE family transposase
VRTKYKALAPVMDERMRRLWAAAEAMAIGRGGISQVARATGLSRPTIQKGIGELREKPKASAGTSRRIRRPGAGRKPLLHHDPGLPAALEALVDPVTRGDPQSALRWTSKSVRKLAAELTVQGHPVSPQKVSQLLRSAGYSVQGTRKTREGAQHPDRNAQFEYINGEVKRFQRRGQPVISVDTKKKELVGDFANGGREWQPKGEPEKVRVHDFLDENLGKAIPYGVYDIVANEGWVSVGIDHDTADFAAESVRHWWQRMGRRLYPDATELLITADGGGSNGYRSRCWKLALQELADRLGMTLTVCHLPPGTSKWNKIEHRMFCHITQNWRGRPLISHAAVVNLIAATTTSSGLRIKAKLDTHAYPTGVKVRDSELAQVHLTAARFHGEWNYSIDPRSPK